MGIVYATVVIDPPWPIQNRVIGGEGTGFHEGNLLDYRVMSLSEIEAMPVRSVMDNMMCIVFCWTTRQFLPKTFDIMEGWGCHILASR